ncbi:protein kinase [Pendulispora brunnea]|uniref:Protein kinase n=1 Tax=Pendulispora brunnea TaxID=2905690 RepID=A0ABZ2JV86_9BACT
MDDLSRGVTGEFRGIEPHLPFAEGRFLVEKEAGRGGMGIVYRAFDRMTERAVALKVLRKTDATAIRRFATEADALGKLEHPDIVRYLAQGIAEDGSPYLAIEWIEGENLSARLGRAIDQREQLPLEDVLELGQRLASALAAAHAIGIVHRDVKPSNILLVGGNLRRPKLADFGIVRAANTEHETTAGTMLGTVGYMAPEQARGEEHLDGRADLFSLGCVLFRCLTYRDPFAGPDPVTVLSLLLTQHPPRPSELRPDVPPDLDALVMQLLSKERERRPASASDVERVLLRIAQGVLGQTLTSHRLVYVAPHSVKSVDKTIDPPPTTRAWRPRWMHAAIAVAIAGAAIGVAFRPWQRAPDPTPQAAPPPGPTVLTAFPAAPSCNPRAVAAYQHGLQELHEGRWDGAARAFDLAAQADPSCPQAVLRRFLISREQVVPISLRRERLREIARLRDALSERDRLVLEAFAMVVTEDVPRREEAVRRLDEAVRRFPMDAELLFRAAGERMNVAKGPEDFEAALELVRRAAELDPTYSDAWQTQARLLEHLGRDNEVQAALERCLTISPGSVDCMKDRVFALSREGKCDEAVSFARRRSSWDPDDPTVYRSLAETLATTRAPKEAIEEVLQQRYGRLPDDVREGERLLDRAQLEAWLGQFDAALATAERLERHLANSASRESHWARAMLSAESLFEMGDPARASQVAEQALLRKDAWTPDQTIAVSAAPTEAWLLGAAFRGGRRTAAQWHEAARTWERANEGSVNAFERWALTWGASKLESQADAVEATGNAPSIGPREGARHFHVAWHVGVLDTFAGHIFLQAGNPARALPLLENGARACQSLEYPFVNVRAHLWLGMAKEKLGETAAACTAYRFVVDRWGHATPRSVTAIEAERRMRALACKS